METAIQPLNDERQEIGSGGAEGAGQPNDEPFEGIYRQHHERVYSLCLRMTGDEEKAYGLMEEAFARLFRKLGTFRGAATFYATYARRPQTADFVAEWICRQSEQYQQPPSSSGWPRPRTGIPRG